jgi:hypothetical protein
MSHITRYRCPEEAKGWDEYYTRKKKVGIIEDEIEAYAYDLDRTAAIDYDSSEAAMEIEARNEDETLAYYEQQQRTMGMHDKAPGYFANGYTVNAQSETSGNAQYWRQVMDTRIHHPSSTPASVSDHKAYEAMHVETASEETAHAMNEAFDQGVASVSADLKDWLKPVSNTSALMNDMGIAYRAIEGLNEEIGELSAEIKNSITCSPCYIRSILSIAGKVVKRNEYARKLSMHDPSRGLYSEIYYQELVLTIITTPGVGREVGMEYKPSWT